MRDPVIHEHLGYRGVAEWDEDDGEYAGRVLDVRHVIAFQGDTEDAVRRSMEETIDAYLAGCRAAGDEPQRPATMTPHANPSDLHRP